MITFPQLDGILQSVANWGDSHLDTSQTKPPMIPVVCHFLHCKLPISKQSNTLSSIFIP